VPGDLNTPLPPTNSPVATMGNRHGDWLLIVTRTGAIGWTYDPHEQTFSQEYPGMWCHVYQEAISRTGGITGPRDACRSRSGRRGWGASGGAGGRHRSGIWPRAVGGAAGHELGGENRTRDDPITTAIGACCARSGEFRDGDR